MAEIPRQTVTPAPLATSLGTASRSSAVADVAGLHVAFRREGRNLQALRGVDLRIQSGEIVGLVGESGSGKTVLGLSMLGLLPKTARTEGTVMVDGVELNGADESTRRRLRRRALGAVFQDPMTSLDPTMRIGRQVQEVAGSTAEALRLLEAVGIPDAQRRLRDFPHELSGGLRQRVMLAIALAARPKLVIADEPTTALDVTVQAQVLALFRRMRDEFGCAILLVTHDLAVASTVADRICVLYGGLVAEVGQVRAVLDHPGHPYTAALMASRIGLHADRDSQLPVIAGEPVQPSSDPVGCNFAPRCPAAAVLCREQRPALAVVSKHGGLAACHFQAGEDVARTLSTIATPWVAAASGRSAGNVTVHRLSVRFPGRRGLRRSEPFDALSDIDLSVAPGEAVALVGESGSGKTTLLRAIAGLQAPTSGRVDLGGGRRPQMVFQDAGSSFTPWLTVGQQLEERVAHLPATVRRERVLEALARLGLPGEVSRVRALQLSGGQRQRAALARAVIEPPDLLLCDEPISALDASLAATVLNLLGRLRRELGFAMVFVTHDLAAARLVADRITVMTRGRIVEEGTPDTVISQPSNPYTQTLLASVPEVATCP
ncbi:MAG: ABC transporter ATP-binding protein [Actinomycetota bacterium]|nr:ABC transporter ATP-binding protein [Nocardioidaceae bacterium]MDQ3481742.1 ABC transporter ATP-binding protein [Actinomycetota bacterium]